MPARISRTVLIVLDVLIGLLGIGGGIATATGIDPFPQEWIAGTPFGSYLIPGIILTLAVGVTAAVAAVGMLRRARWGPLASVFAGASMIGFLMGEILILNQPVEPTVTEMVFFAIGAAMVVLGLAAQKGVAAARRRSGPARQAEWGTRLTSSASQLWEAYVASGSPAAASALGATYSAWQFGYGVEQGDRLLECVLEGPKRATAGALWAYEAEGERVPVPGDHSVLLDGHGVARCVIRTTHVEVVPFDQVDAAFAYDEGEGDRSLEYWRDVHWKYFVRELAGLGLEATRDMPVVCERFEVVYRPEEPSPAERAYPA